MVPVALSMAVVVQLVVLYAPEVPGPPSPIPHSDKVVHAFVFALPVLVAGLGRRVWWPVVALLVAVHAPVSEVIQHVVLPRRSGDPWDVVADLVGVGLSSIGVLLVVRRLRRRRT
ncbi:VanZ family protein [Janibacter limosus]|uniref:VanZ family protein n=1 Tax=Janibacter limosus TaxID=53458 RepID=A0A4P6N0B4_9MICO|nr:VanZ family protein [Janibacter limosus]